MRITRRGFTAGLAGTILAAPFTRLLTGEGRARAQGAAAARRLLVFYSPNGTLHRYWRPEGDADNFRFIEGGILEPLADRRDQLLLVDGLDFYNGDNHEGGAD